MLIAWHLIELNNKCWLCINDVAVIIVIFLLIKTKIVVKNSLHHQEEEFRNQKLVPGTQQAYNEQLLLLSG